jgi:polysaccharide biosynthesis protein PslH
LGPLLPVSWDRRFVASGTDILFLVHRAPWPPDRGDRIRSWHLFEALRKIAPVHVAAFADNADDVATASDMLRPRAASAYVIERRQGRAGAMVRALASGKPASLALFDSDEMRRHVTETLSSGRIGTIVIFSSQMAQYVSAASPHPVIMDFVDVDSAKFAAYAADDGFSPMRFVHAREGRLLAAWESRVARQAALSLFVSEAEAALFRSRFNGDASRIRVLENGIDLDRFNPAADMSPIDRPAGPLVVFTGQMDYRPNVEAVSWFVQACLPRLRARVPNAQFAIVGRAATAEVQALAAVDGVIVTGEVPDTRPWLAAAAAVVAPLAVARGVQNKVLEAMAMARPVIVSPSAGQGIDAEAGRELMIAAGPDEWIDACVDLLTNPPRGAAMGAAARARMIARYSWGATLAPLAAMIGQGVAHE